MGKHTHEELMDRWKNASKKEKRRVVNDMSNLRNTVGTIYSAVVSVSLDAVQDDCAGVVSKLGSEATEAIDCTKCSNCCKEFNCGTPQGDELAAIAKYLNESPVEVAAKWKTGGQGRCPMLGENGRCTVYEVRPSVCRRFPHLPTIAHEDGGDMGYDYICKASRLPEERCLRCPIAYHVASNVVEGIQLKADLRKNNGGSGGLSG